MVGLIRARLLSFGMILGIGFSVDGVSGGERRIGRAAEVVGPGVQ